MIDSHCHLADEAFAGDLPEVVARARSAGVTSALCILDAASEDERLRAAVVREAWPEVRFAVGVHPHHAGHYREDAAEAVRVTEAALAEADRPVAIGEIGLDYHYDFATPAVQQRVFSALVRLARERGLPVVIHTREADQDTVRILRETGGGGVRGVFHCFTGDRALAEAALELGFHLSFSGIVSFPKAGALREVAAGVPEDRLLVETDSPYLAPVPHRGKRNEPAFVINVAEAVAALRGTTPEALGERTCENFVRLFGA